jgi:hemerythrin
MPLLTWTEEMSVGVRQLDDDHKRLIAMINDLHDGMVAGQNRAVVGDILRRLAKYAIVHFRHEEQYFDQTGYPGAAAHKRAHEELKTRVAAEIEKYLSGSGVGHARQLINFLREWWKHHIQETDKSYTAHLNAHGVR